MKSYNWGIIAPGSIAHDFANNIKLLPVKQQILMIFILVEHLFARMATTAEKICLYF